MRSKAEISPRNEYLIEENQRANASPSVAEAFPMVTAMAVDLSYFDSERPERTSQIKYRYNLEHAKSVWRVDCQNSECVGGDFDLSDILAEAVADRRAEVTGRLLCQGWRTRTLIGSARCGKIIEYHLTLEF